MSIIANRPLFLVQFVFILVVIIDEPIINPFHIPLDGLKHPGMEGPELLLR